MPLKSMPLSNPAAKRWTSSCAATSAACANHHRDRTAPVEFDGASSYILAPSEDVEDAEPATLQPIVIAEMETKIPSITVGEAVMQLELGSTACLCSATKDMVG
jgi:hypothetical protein